MPYRLSMLLTLRAKIGLNLVKLCDGIKEGMRNFRLWIIDHVKRDAKSAAHYFARKAIKCFTRLEKSQYILCISGEKLIIV
jgi:hypothetical protein